MYKGSKSRISVNNELSEVFPCNIGVRQGENLSPFLFALFLNDLDMFLSTHNVDSLATISNAIEQELNVMIKILLMLYADDTVLFSESKEGLQYQLDCFLQYCKDWKLEVNIDKTKIMIFTKGSIPQNHSFYYDGKQLEIVKKFKYLGIFLSQSASFMKTKKYVSNRALKAMYAVLKKGRCLNLSITDQLHLFDKIVVPVLLYGCEIWGFGNLDIIERIHLKFCKMLLHL